MHEHTSHWLPIIRDPLPLQNHPQHLIRSSWSILHAFPNAQTTTITIIIMPLHSTNNIPEPILLTPDTLPVTGQKIAKRRRPIYSLV